jgi:hypothetical protein
VHERAASGRLHERWNEDEQLNEEEAEGSRVKAEENKVKLN